MYGVEFVPRDLKLALFEAAEGRVGDAIDRVVLSCFKYDPAKRRYGFWVFGALRTGGAAVLLGAGLAFRRLRRVERAREASS